MMPAEPAIGRVVPKVRPRRLRLIPDLDRSAAIVEFVQTWPGRLAVLGAFAALVTLHHGRTLFIAGAGLAALWPSRRRLWVFLATISLPLRTGLDEPVLQAVAPDEIVAGLLGRTWIGPAVALTALLLASGYVQLARSIRTGWLRDHPLASWLSLYAGSIAIVSVVPLGATQRALAWSLVSALDGYVWFAAYSLKDRGGRPGRDVVMEASAYRPFWGGTHTPFPKAGSALTKIEVRTPVEAAVWQLKALKLLAWALVLVWLRALLLTLLNGEPSFGSRWIGGIHLSIPDYPDALARSRAGVPYPFHENWLALIRSFVLGILDLSIFGHVVIAGARMAGFKALRNTFRPLESRNLADFWNRYYFYFKELLVDFFFFPTFLRFFKTRPRIRLLFATFAAAGFGNFLYHYLGATKLIASLGVGGALRAMQAYALYALLLSLGIGLSQLRKRPAVPTRGNVPGTVRLATLFGVLGFYCLLEIPGAAPPGTTLGECCQFLKDLTPLR
jgi:hypothetical protein